MTTKTKKIQSRQEEIIEIIKSNPNVTKREIGDILGISVNGVTYHIKNMTKDGIIEYIGMRNTYKYTRLYSGTDPLFEEGSIFRTIVPLKKIATLKVGGNGVAHDVAHDVARDAAHDVAHDLAEFIKNRVRQNVKVTRKTLAEEFGVSIKTIERAMKGIDDLRYIGSGSSGYWELRE